MIPRFPLHGMISIEKELRKSIVRDVRPKNLEILYKKLVSKLMNPTIDNSIVTETVKAPKTTNTIIIGTLYGEKSEDLWFWSTSKNSRTKGTYEGQIVNQIPSGKGNLVWFNTLRG